MAKRSGKKRKNLTANSGKRLDRRALAPGRPENLKPFVKGDPRINLSGRPKLIGEAGKRILASLFPPDMISAEFKKIVAAYTGDPQAMITFAERIMLSQAMKAATGDTNATREMRSATEGTKIRTWQDELIDLLRSGQLTAEELRKELGDDADIFIAAAGQGGENSRTDPQRQAPPAEVGGDGHPE